jgi:beta-N-acetylhexosaminidase
MHSFRGYTPPPDVLEGVRRGDIAAFCLFAYNVESPAQLRALTEALFQAARDGGHPPPLTGIDQEGGQLIAIMNGATELPGNMALGAARSAELAEQAGRLTARELLAMGCNLNFAPVLDIDSGPRNAAQGLRSFGDDPPLVSELGRAFIRGMQNEGVIATAKHYPGSGNATGDTHHVTARVSRSREELERLEFAPFRDAIADGVGAIMMSHVAYPALDGDTPASVSAPVIGGVLRRDMGFDGLVISDAMDMQAVAVRGHEASLTQALQAGNDLVLMGHLPNQLAMTETLRPRLNPESAARIRRARQKAPTDFLPFDLVGCAEHQQIAQTIADASITLVRDDGRLPLRPGEESQIVVITPRPLDLTPADTSSMVTIRLAERIRARHARATALELPFNASAEAVQETLNAAADADLVVVGTITADQDDSQAALVNALIERGQQPVVVALRTPYDIRALPGVRTYVCSYGIRPVSMEAVARVLFGEIEARGRLPVAFGEVAAR